MASTSTQSSSRPSSRSRRKTAENWDDDFEFALPTRPRPASSQASSKENAPVQNLERSASAKPTLGRGTPESSSSWSESPPASPTIIVRREKPSLTLSSSPRTTTSEATDLPTASTSHHPLLPHDIPLPPTVRHRSGSSSKNKLIKRHPSASFTPMTHVGASSSSLASYANRSTPHLRHTPSVEVMPPPPIPSRRPGSRGQVRISGIPFSPSQDDMREGKRGFWKRLSGVPGETSGHRRRRSSSVGSPTKDGETVPPLPPLPPNVRSSSSTSVTSNASQTVSAGSSQGPTSILRRSTSSLSQSGNTPPSAYNRPVTPPKAFSRGFHLPSPVAGSPYRPSAQPHSASSLPHSHSLNDVAHDSDTEIELDGPTPRRKRIRPVSAAPAPRYDPTAQPSRLEVRSAASTAAPASGFTTSTLRRISSISKKHGRRLSGGFKFGTTSSTSSGESKPLETVMGSPSKPPTHRPEPSTEIDLRDVRAESVSAPNSSFRTAPKSLAANEALQAKTDKQRRRQSWNDFVIPTKVLERQRELKQEIGAVKKFAGGLERVGKLVDLHSSLAERVSPGKVASFEALEAEFGQWWEMATVLIEVGATGTGSEDMSPRSRRITLASDEAKKAGELLRATDMGTFGPRKTSLPDPGSPGTFPEQWRASTGRQDLSKRQLEVLRTMLRTPVPTATMRRLPTTPQRQNDISFPSPSDSDFLEAPSPATASSLAQPKRPGLKSRRSSKAGLAGLKDFLRSLKRDSPSEKPSRSPTKSAFSRESRETTPISPTQHEFPTSRTSLSISGSGGFVNISPPRRIPSPDKAPKRPSIRNIFRTSSGNWSELVRPPQTPPVKSGLERKSSRSSRKSVESGESGDPGLPRSRIPKTPTSAFGFSPPWKSPAKSQITPDMRDKTIRPRSDKRERRSQVIGLGNPGSPAERAGIPGLSGANGLARGERGVVVSNPDPAAPKEVDGMTRSASAPMVSEAGDDMVVALTPENLPVLLEYLRQCEAKLGEWKVKVERVMEE